MKKYLILFSLSILFSLVFVACEDDSTGPDPANSGYLRVESTPPGASIYLNSETSSRGTTPATLTAPAGTHSITLRLSGFRDTTITGVEIAVGDTSFRHLTLTTSVVPPNLSKYTNVRIWEITGTGPSQPSGLDLSEGVAKSSNDASIDLFYYSSGSVYELRTSSTRSTSFFIGSGTNVDDTVDSPLATTSWLDMVADNENNYFFAFDADGHYSKLKITNSGGGSGNPNDPAWVELTWYYNETVNDERFGDNN